LGYLSDWLDARKQNWADCPEAYPYAMVIEYVLRDKYMYPKPDDAIALAVKERLPDIEDWQQSVIRTGRLKLRFHRTTDRDTARDALSDVPIEIAITNVTYMNPPDLVDVGEVEP
jgi:hypothetical protein